MTGGFAPIAAGDAGTSMGAIEVLSEEVKRGSQAVADALEAARLEST